ncbi:uncharacterized protein LOC119383680 isoform X1 [Rhipicephalus sanguineus]|uniref:uncharacterized protein LOC119383680 isoform X1 n=1 Tax=Rhipicephalus sanguineus TaxID=34632 RepID=UPI001894966E|nr:uncharacterized protein LOC119383680 isoform X1 [Rhipicephalus sanguineus]
MRNAALLLMLVIFAPIDEVSSFAFGAFLARLMVRLPQLLRPALRIAGHMGHYAADITEVALDIHRKAEELELPDVYGIAMAPPPGPHDLLHNPNDDITGYTGPGIAGVPEFSANSSTLITCGKCHCTFPWQAKFYGDKVGCTSDVKKFSCTCTHKSCNTGKLVKCLNNLAKGKCVSYRYHIDCLVSNKNTG